MTRKNKAMKYNYSRTRKIKLFAAAVVLICAVVGGIVTVRLYRQRKATEKAIAERTYVQMEPFTRFQSETVEYEGKTYRRSSYVKAILLMGVDRKGPMSETTVYGQGGQADGVFLVAQDTARNTLKILMIPRDTMTYITLTDLQGNVLGKDIQHLTLAYAYGDGRELSCERMVEAVSELLGGMSIDHYLAADIDVISILNDSVGGVTVTVPIDGMEKRDPAFVKGATVTLQGDQAEAFVRYRDIGEDFSAIYRMDRQKQYITGFFQSIKRESAKNSGIVTDIFDRIQEHMITDMGKEEYLKVAMDALGGGELRDEDVYIVTGESRVTDVYDEFYPDPDVLTDQILDMFYREI